MFSSICLNDMIRKNLKAMNDFFLEFLKDIYIYNKNIYLYSDLEKKNLIYIIKNDIIENTINEKYNYKINNISLRKSNKLELKISCDKKTKFIINNEKSYIELHTIINKKKIIKKYYLTIISCN